MINNSQGAKQLTLEQLEDAHSLLSCCYERIIEINAGTYHPDMEPSQFDSQTSSRLSTEIESILNISTRLYRLVNGE